MKLLSLFKKKNTKTVDKKKSPAREWVDAILFAVIAATLIRGLLVEAYAIPTASMENTMMVGDRLFVSKLHYGTRTPRTLLQLPLMHQTVLGTDIPSYLDWVELPTWRMPSFTSVKRNDIVVFNYPVETHRPVDMRTFYVKRCIGMPGDTFTVVKKQVHINGKSLENPVPLQSTFIVKTKEAIHDRIFKSHNISDIIKTSEGYVVQTSKTTAEELAQLPFITEVMEFEYKPSDSFTEGMFPKERNLGWTVDNFGPLYIPNKGHEIILSDENTALYKDVIIHHEGNQALYKDGKIYIEGKPIEKYTFKQDYYFMLGDNRNNSEDSRMWGFVPSDHIVGKPLFVLYSLEDTEKGGNIFSNIRWSRIFHLYN